MSELGLFDLFFADEWDHGRSSRRETNQQAYLNRISSNVKRFRQRYADMLDDLRRQGLDVWVREEYDEIHGMLVRLDRLMTAGEVERARDLSFEIGQAIHGIFLRAHQAKKRSERHERQLAREEKERQDAEMRRQARQNFVEQMKRDLETGEEGETPTVRETVRKLNDLQQESPDLSEAELRRRLATELAKADRAIADETVRREAVKAIYQSLKKAGFLVDTPQLAGDDVLLRARKPAGSQAEFTVKLDGSGSYKFDRYEGQMCRKDLGEVTDLLAECYGIRLEKTSVQWSNPDRIQKGARDNPAGGGFRTGAGGNG